MLNTASSSGINRLAFPRITNIHLKQFFTSITFLIMLAHVGVFVYASSLSGIASPGANATLGPLKCALLSAGAKFSPFVLDRGEAWRLVTSLFLHSGLVTLLLTLILEGLILLPFELTNKAKGKVFLLPVFLICGIAGNSFSCVASPLQVDTGALSSILGFVGLSLTGKFLQCFRGPENKLVPLDLVVLIVAILVGESTFVDTHASFVGFIMGVFLGGCFYSVQVQFHPVFLRYALLLASLFASCFLMFACLYLLFGGPYLMFENILVHFVCRDYSARIPYY